MSSLVLDVALLWLLVLLAAGSVAIVRWQEPVRRIVAFDFLTLVVVPALLVLSYARGVVWYLDTALVLALLSFVATMALAKSRTSRRMFR